ncbi:3-oxoacyl-ACP reductase FabG [Streptomyces afghaniensis]|uniref:3-oxoacyl-ACP reductase FabG n=1 Tax=Streptomyces afghaniensis TaxID=66865 RepID=UPI00277DA774|nr:3-oxoacyl-ACP reductase FabG [Streptomyces afghaniensis]MDQ1018917.1 3-oxoacyl-[acyl-carrier protein] reductase [Streptomyces afghaniensis]
MNDPTITRETGCALVTGGSRGIGRAIAVQLAEDGYDVGFCYRKDHEAALETAQLVGRAGRRSFHRAVDVTDFSAVSDFAEEAQEKLGQVSVAVAGAGITRDRSLALMPPDDWSAVLRTNLDGAFHLSRAVLMGMIRRKSGSLILISSVAGFAGNAGQANYAASKSGMHGLAGSLSKETGRHGVRVNVVAPGFIESDMVAGLSVKSRLKAEQAIPMGRFGEAHQVAAAVSFLASARAAYITGSILRVDGGLTL